MNSSSSTVATVQLCYEHLNGSCVKTPYSPAPCLILYTVFSFGAVLAVFGNLLVMISILHFKQLHSPTNFLIASLACADFLVGVTVMPFSTVRSVESCWYFGESYCKFHTCFDGSFCYASIYHLCFISLDRYIAITDPLVYPTRFTMSVSGMCVAFSWLFSIIYSFSLLGTGANAAGLEDLISALTCVGGCQVAVNQSWVLVNFILFFIPTLVMIVLYSNVFLIAKQQARKIENLRSKTGRCSNRYQDRVAKRERKAAKTLGIAVLAFLISWLPFFLDSIIDAFLGFITPTYIYEILVWIAYYNSAMNPLIYAFFYPWFRKAIKLIVTGKVLRENSSTVNLFSGVCQATVTHPEGLEEDAEKGQTSTDHKDEGPGEPGLHLRTLLSGVRANEVASSVFLMVVEHSPSITPVPPRSLHREKGTSVKYFECTSEVYEAFVISAIISAPKHEPSEGLLQNILLNVKYERRIEFEMADVRG
ncbi:trace amine-associated receptor 7a-like [Bos indicus]|uniref:Trace amine-associated receptor 7a-like n=1 Tax=Bos indicus TaxID=9915 RepID=A0ABM4SVD4_BOSIN